MGHWQGRLKQFTPPTHPFRQLITRQQHHAIQTSHQTTHHKTEQCHVIQASHQTTHRKTAASRYSDQSSNKWQDSSITLLKPVVKCSSQDIAASQSSQPHSRRSQSLPYVSRRLIQAIFRCSHLPSLLPLATCSDPGLPHSLTSKLTFKTTLHYHMPLFLLKVISPSPSVYHPPPPSPDPVLPQAEYSPPVLLIPTPFPVYCPTHLPPRPSDSQHQVISCPK